MKKLNNHELSKLLFAIREAHMMGQLCIFNPATGVVDEVGLVCLNGNSVQLNIETPEDYEDTTEHAEGFSAGDDR